MTNKLPETVKIPKSFRIFRNGQKFRISGVEEWLQPVHMTSAYRLRLLPLRAVSVPSGGLPLWHLHNLAGLFSPALFA
ncbi:hypothetical protein HED51_13450 [Ochrobactrum grignonense]|nr:hypothetical protein [Brucella grignonensis]